MNTSRASFLSVSLLLCILTCTAAAIRAEEPRVIQLPPPVTQGGMPLMDALQARMSTKAYSERPVSEKTLSDLLWAAFGINRPESGKRTAPSAFNRQEIDIYVMLASGTYVYDAQAHELKLVLEEDLRSEAAGGESKYENAPVQLVYVADFSRMRKVQLKKKSSYAAVHSGFIGQNVYLFCASRGLGAGFRDTIDREALTTSLALREDQEVVFAQTVGHPPEAR